MTHAQHDQNPAAVVLSDAPDSSRLPADEDSLLRDDVAILNQRRIAAKLRESMIRPALWTQQVRNFSGTTLGLMTLITLLLTVAILSAGMSMSQSTERRQDAITNLISNTEPMSATAQDLFTSLSLADTIAATGFVQAGVELPATRENYQRAIQRSALAATQTAAGLGTEPSRELELIGQIQTQLPVYTGLVEIARTNNRLGNPVGVAYMSQASSLMRTSILPAARELLDSSNNSLNEKQQALARPQWIPISGLAAALILLILAQRWLALKTRRRLNRGFLAATAFMTVALLWVIASNGLTWYSGNKGYEEAAAPLRSLTDARVLAQQARTAETMALVRRETSAESIEDFDAIMTKVDKAMQSYRDSSLIERGDNRAESEQISQAIVDWQDRHQKLRRALAQGEYNSGVQLVFHGPAAPAGTSDGTTAAAYDQVDAGLAKLMKDARQMLRSYFEDGLMATRWVSPIVAILSLASVAAIWIGIRPRLQEYL